ncbi:hypothetical protein OHW31_07400 [Acinetobacter baumannii]|uniref:hypothetical protein n=1 Tax=Acinetobacter baumannii TaxID=470 RepID=UPI00135FA6E8|nr:hypothetical protein [Acinetobacter baumannii]MDC4769534.1 hypothetical protein [Acinetobacter baumannii]MDC5067096.1 hypothetical protein [Acinetobacter baumannii]MDC5273119.1 hypothetical protein [Acinetobacter baumannii]MDC5294852.1 hypothetical protein [Acinetobacter baumannii]MDC5504210.1 hypothetical protein [Acinetobacter baumannii]
MTGILAEKLPQPDGSGSLKTWLQADAYAKRILLGSVTANPWENVSGYVTWFSQAQNLIKSHVSVISIAEVFDRQVEKEGGLEGKLGNRKKAKVAIRRLIELEDARTLINEVLTAVLDQATQPVVVSMPSPKAWLYHATRLAGLDTQDICDEDIEDAAAYIADLLRALSSHQLAGVLLEEMADDPQWSDAQVQYYRPLLNIAQHYRWSVVLRLPHDASISTDVSQHFAAVIGNIRSNQKTSTGVDVSLQFNQELGVPALSSGEFYFIEIDENSLPEKITERVGAIQKAA